MNIDIPQLPPCVRHLTVTRAKDIVPQHIVQHVDTYSAYNVERIRPFRMPTRPFSFQASHENI